MYKDERLLTEEEKEIMLKCKDTQIALLNGFQYLVKANVRPPEELTEIVFKFLASEGFTQEELSMLKNKTLRLPKTKHSLFPSRISESSGH